MLGYKSTKSPSWKNPYQFHWKAQEGFQKALLFGDKDGCEYAVVWVTTKSARQRR